MAILPSLDPKNADLEEAIRRVIRDNGNPQKIQVVARDGYVNLTGSVDRLEAKKKIGALVESVPGVQIVTNHIHVIAWEEKRGPSHF